MRRNSARGDRGGAKGEAQQAPVARARPKKAAPASAAKRGEDPTQSPSSRRNTSRRLTVAGVGLGVVVRAQVRRPIDEDRAQRARAASGRRAPPPRRRPSSESARLVVSAIAPSSSASMTTISDRGECIPAPECEHRIQGQRKRDSDAADHRLDPRVMPFAQREQSSEALGKLERAHNQHETADVGHASRGDRDCRGVSDEDGGERQARGLSRALRRGQVRRGERNRAPGSPSAKAAGAA